MAEVRIVDDVRVRAPVGDVWAAIVDPVAQASWHPFVTRIEGEHALDAPRTCSVIVGGKEGSTRERCVELDSERAIRWAIDEDTTGFARLVTDWRAGFRLEPGRDGTRVFAESVFVPRSFLVRVLAPVVRRKFHRAQQEILLGLAGRFG